MLSNQRFIHLTSYNECKYRKYYVESYKIQILFKYSSRKSFKIFINWIIFFWKITFVLITWVLRHCRMTQNHALFLFLRAYLSHQMWLLTLLLYKCSFKRIIMRELSLDWMTPFGIIFFVVFKLCSIMRWKLREEG